MKLQTAIKQAKAKLIERCEKNGLYENFGQKELMQLSNKYIDISQYTNEMNVKRAMLQDFDNWCKHYNG